MSWLVLLILGCPGGLKESAPVVVEVDDCSDGHVSYEASEAAEEEPYCRYSVECGRMNGETYEECVERYETDKEGCVFDESLYDGYRVCACALSWEGRDCSMDRDPICSDPWWDCGTTNE